MLMLFRKRLAPFFGALFLAAASATPARAVILYRTGDVTANTTAPTGSLAGSGWQYEGLFGSFLGTPIAPHFFITARHIGMDSTKLVFQGNNYTIVGTFDDPQTDLRIYQVTETFPTFAPLYLGSAEVGKHLVVIGRGKQRGAAVTSNGATRGWQWGTSDYVQRWGENIVAAIKSSMTGDLLYATFDGSSGLTNEAHLANGDSGGGVFILDDDGVWKLAGINYDVDGPFYTGANNTGGFYAALFDERGFYYSGALVGGSAAVPSGFIATRISARTSWIISIIQPQLVNISARATVGVDDQVAIAGFIITGDANRTQRILLRGIGPSLQVNGMPVPGRLNDPFIELHDASGASLATNDNWQAGTQASDLQNSGLAPTNDQESALIAALPPGNYTAVLRDAANGSGLGLIEVYELDGGIGTPLLNLSARAYVGADDNVLIGGVIVRSATQRLLLRGIGPTLASGGVNGPLQDPFLELHDANGQSLATNDNWMSASNASDISATGLAPNNPAESALLVTPGIGSYTAILRGVSNTTGVALLEAYLLN